MTIGTNYSHTGYPFDAAADGSLGRAGSSMGLGTSPDEVKRSGVSPEEVKKPGDGPDEVKKPGRQSSPAECETCKNRKYQDGSDEANVSFKSAAHISPESAGARVRAHEGEHVANAYKKAAQKNGRVVRASVSIHTAVCPECGRTYVSGGTTSTMIKYTNEQNPYVKAQKSRDAAAFGGANIDCAV